MEMLGTASATQALRVLRGQSSSRVLNPKSSQPSDNDNGPSTKAEQGVAAALFAESGGDRRGGRFRSDPAPREVEASDGVVVLQSPALVRGQTLEQRGWPVPCSVRVITGVEQHLVGAQLLVDLSSCAGGRGSVGWVAIGSGGAHSATAAPRATAPRGRAAFHS